MANVLKHRFTSAKADGADATQVQPSHWNDGHLFTGGTAGQVLTRDPADAIYGAAWQTPATPPAATDTVLLPTTTGTVHDWAPGLSGHTFIEWLGTADLTITGLAGGVSGQRVTIANHGTAGVIRLAHGSTGSAVGNRFKNLATSAPTPIAVGGSATFVYGQEAGAGAWIMIGHAQGAGITAPYSAANFTANGSMTWVVEAGDQITMRYTLNGRMLSIAYQIETSTIGGTASFRLYIGNGAWGGFSVPPGVTYAWPAAYFSNAPATTAPVFAQIYGTTIALGKADGSNFSLNTNGVVLMGTATIEVS